MRPVAVLIRAVNVGGTGKLPMAELRAFLTSVGHPEARTLLASGNAVIASDEPLPRLEERLEREAAARLNRALTIIARDADDLDALVAANPLVEAARERPQHLIVTFGRAPVDPALLAALAAHYQGPETLEPVGRELLIDYATGIGDSRLDAAMRKLRFPLNSTARSWNTVLRLRAMLDQRST